MNEEAAYRHLELRIPREESLSLIQVLDEGQALPDLTGYYEVLYDESRPSVEHAVLMLYFPLHAEAAALQVQILLEAVGIGDYGIQEKQVAKTDYLLAYQEHYRSFRISRRLVIVPSWEKESIELSQFRSAKLSDQIEAAEAAEAAEALNEAEADAEFDLLALYLDPGLAFGTGKHPTTELCLQFLDDLKPNGMRIVDAGAGSGILSLGALLLGARSVFAFDIDGNALTAMRQNLRMNCPPLVEGQLSAHHGGFDLPELERELEHADLLLGNITAGVILQNQNVIMSGSHRRMALSGILSEQSDRVVEAFQPAWRLNRMLTNDGWVLLDMERVS